MSSIPYDPSLTLGQVVDLERLENLKKLAAAQKPLDTAYDKLNNVMMTSYKLEMVETEMINLGVEESKLDNFRAGLLNVRKKISAAAINYGRTALDVSKNVELLKNQMAQTKISSQVESPLDYTNCEVQKFPLAYDSLNFDVQYVRNEENKEGASSHARQVASMVAGATSGYMSRSNSVRATNINNNVLKQTTSHTIEGTVVITANATHKNADIISPFVIDPIKAVTAWNSTYSDDEIKTDPASIMKAALDNYKTKPADKKCLNILSGCTRGSSFVGCVHILQQETSTSSQTASSFASGLKSAQELDGWFNAASGGYGNSQSFANSAQDMMSKSMLTSHCTMVCEGLIPSIVANSVATTVKEMELDPKAVMEQLSAIQEAGNSGVNSTVESQAEESKRGGQFMALNSEYMKNAVTTIAEVESESNQVIDTNSLMTAFEDFVNKAMEGESGIPINFYIKRLTKNDIAKAYIRRFYPNGVKSGKDAYRGQLGQEPEEKEEKEE
mmetsp:Transcript_40581/g.46150  ORF Transcript_40581/g.46150 Transcript_40581/m.46150 type:complete len:501 (-) Transcript_40581:38-1540(-)